LLSAPRLHDRIPVTGDIAAVSSLLRRYRAALARGFTQGEFRRYLVKAAAASGLLPSKFRYELAVVDRPAYAYGLLAAASEANKLGLSAITAIEFGVGAGNGLLAMEEHARHVTRLTNVPIAIVGFDAVSGLPEPVDYRDLPYTWAAGFYPMDEVALRSRLTVAELVLGDVRDTVSVFAAERQSALQARPVGFISFDLDYWSSTVAAFDIFRTDPAICMPRVTCYFDDVQMTIEDVGELRAIRDFNEEPYRRRIRQQHSLKARLPFQPLWADQIFVCHLFDHPLYGQLMADRKAERVELRRQWQ
jgi:hypothetical protein